MLEVRNVYKSFEVSGTEHMVLDDLSFTVQDRDFYIILGQSGCGKSTILNLISGLLKPEAGTLLSRGRNLLREKLGGDEHEGSAESHL